MSSRFWVAYFLSSVVAVIAWLATEWFFGLLGLETDYSKVGPFILGLAIGAMTTRNLVVARLNE